MTIYFSLLLIIFILSCFVGKKNIQNNIILFLIVALIFIFMGFRKDFTPDYFEYEIFFNKFKGDSIDKQNRIEFGYQWLNILLPSYRMVIIVSTLLFCSALVFSFRCLINPKFWWIGFLILFLNTYFLLGNTSGIRSSFVTSSFIFAIYFLIKKKPLFYIGILILASFFHSSSLFLLPLVIITSKNISTNKKRIIFSGAIIFIFISQFIPNIVNSLTINLVNSNFNQYENYLQDTLEVKMSFFSIVRIILIVFLFYQTIVNIRNNMSDSNKIMMKFTAFYFILILAPGIGLISRMYYYFTFPFIIGSIFTFSSIKNQLLKYVYILGVFGIVLYDFYIFLNTPTFLFYMNYNSALLK